MLRSTWRRIALATAGSLTLAAIPMMAPAGARGAAFEHESPCSGGGSGQEAFPDGRPGRSASTTAGPADGDDRRERGRRATTPPRDPVSIDDGQSLLSAAAITVESSIAAAQAVATGDVGEVDLEVADSGIVFVVDIGGSDVHVDAETGDVLSVNEEE